MIYVSSSCVKHDTIEESVAFLHANGYNNIELSGGTNYADHKQIIANLIRLKKAHGLQYIIHNYFPPPETPFILNLASDDEEVYQQTHTHLINCIDHSNSLEAARFGFHAGFFFNIDLKEIGKDITAQSYEDFDASYNRFIERYSLIKKEADAKGVLLYIENNVYSKNNSNRYGFPAPAMLLSSSDLKQLKQDINFNLLLDIAHLKVSSNTLGLKFEEEISDLFGQSDYIHISDNDGLSDSNQGLKDELFSLLKKLNWKDKIVTLEVYESLEAIKDSHSKITSLL